MANRDTTKAIAEKLIACCRENQEETGLNELYSENAISVEAMIAPGNDSAEAKGLAAIKAKHDWWNENFEVHSATSEGPFLHGDDRFGIIFKVDATNKMTGERHAMQELAIYTVSNDKIVREEFFY